MFFPVENSHFGRPKKKKFNGFEKLKKKKKKKILSSFCNFSSFHFPTSLFQFSFSIFPFFPCPSFPGMSTEISRREESRGHLCPLAVMPLFIININICVLRVSKLIPFINVKTTQLNAAWWTLLQEGGYFWFVVYRLIGQAYHWEQQLLSGPVEYKVMVLFL